MRKLTYIMSPSYSGSTLLTLLIADHPNIATVGELKASAMGDISTYNCSCGELLTNCPFWHKVQQKMLEQGRKLSFNNFNTHFQDSKNPLANRLLRAAFRGPLFEMARQAGFILSSAARKTKQKIIIQNQALIEIICSLQKADTFLDDSKDPIRLKFLLETGLWDIRVIHLIRDGRGVTNSYMRHHNANMNQAAREWVHTQQECNRMAALLGNTRCLKIPYEALCLEPESTLTTIYRFLNLPPKSSSISPRIKHILGNQMRLGSLQDIRLDEKWKKALTQDDLQRFMNLARELNNLHGYK
jgi:hypothetical protein